MRYRDEAHQRFLKDREDLLQQSSEAQLRCGLSGLKSECRRKQEKRVENCSWGSDGEDAHLRGPSRGQKKAQIKVLTSDESCIFFGQVLLVCSTKAHVSSHCSVQHGEHADRHKQKILELTQTSLVTISQSFHPCAFPSHSPATSVNTTIKCS